MVEEGERGLGNVDKGILNLTVRLEGDSRGISVGCSFYRWLLVRGMGLCF